MFGDYDECLDSKVLRSNGNIAFRGQYCMLDIKAVLPMAKRKITLKGGYEELVEYTKNTSVSITFTFLNRRYSEKRSRWLII